MAKSITITLTAEQQAELKSIKSALWSNQAMLQIITAADFENLLGQADIFTLQSALKGIEQASIKCGDES